VLVACRDDAARSCSEMVPPPAAGPSAAGPPAAGESDAQPCAGVLHGTPDALNSPILSGLPAPPAAAGCGGGAAGMSGE